MNYNEFKSVMENVRSIAPGLSCVADLMYRRTRSWNNGYLRFLFGNELGDEIGKIQIVKHGDEDFLIWKNSRLGNFSVKGAYWDAQMHRFGGGNKLWGWIWNGKVHPRLSMMLWRVCENVLPTGDIFCPSVLFCHCLWFGCPYPVRIDTIQDDSIAGMLGNLCAGVDEDLQCKMLSCFAILFDTIWNTKNRIYHESNVTWSVDQARREILKRFSEFSTILASAPSDPGAALVPVESYLISTNMVIVVDGLFSSGSFGCGALALRNDSSDWFFRSSFGACDNALAAELEAIRFGINWAKDYGWDRVTIASDSKVLAKAFRDLKSPDWHITAQFFSALSPATLICYSKIPAKLQQNLALFLLSLFLYQNPNKT
ncbi:hypothetical protein G4B88_013610 [Cannabis sativa]|uniref:RNase H type-1 domain-containing protein n=1 Tax=Cannabis sativa TaxID=3483 RepID=A0A7J6HUI6_CANSA|nr:hypothetical protein G4B88_013610 [Cannabis sativa]